MQIMHFIHLTVTRQCKILVAAICTASLTILTTSCVNIPIKSVTADYWPSPPTDEIIYPEMIPSGHVWNDLREKDDLGICFSGGGTRAATAATGQLRALRALGILDRTRYIAAVSGGSWAATPYIFSPRSNEERLLGPLRSPQQLRNMDDLRTEDASLCRAMTHAYVTGTALNNLVLNLRGSESYSRTISDIFLKPFGLDPDNKWFTWNSATANEVLHRNPELKKLGLAEYQAVPEGKPFLIVGGTIRHYGSPFAKSNPLKRIPIEITPLYTGSGPFTDSNHFSNVKTGGGFVESFAYDTRRAKTAGPGTVSADLYSRPPFRTCPVMTLADMVGVSGAAPGEMNALVEIFGFPKFQYWSPRILHEQGSVEDARLSQQDGGLSENLGLLSLLARKTKKIVAFVNAEDEVCINGDEIILPDYVEQFFAEDGPLTGKNRYERTRVFDHIDRDKIMDQIRSSVAQGGPAVAYTDLKVSPNPRFGVTAYDVSICWIFLEAKVINKSGNFKASRNWIAKLPKCSDVAGLFKNDTKSLRNFPTYATFAENKPSPIVDVIRLEERQASLLANYTSWTVTHERSRLSHFLR